MMIWRTVSINREISLNKFFFKYGLLTAGFTMTTAIFCHSWLGSEQSVTFAYVALVAAVIGWCAFIGSVIYPPPNAKSVVEIKTIEICLALVVHASAGVGLLFLAQQLQFATGISRWILAAAVTAAIVFYLAAAYCIIRLWIVQFASRKP